MDPYNVLRLGTGLNGCLVVTGVERVEVKALDGTRRPESEVGSVPAVSGAGCVSHLVAKPGMGTS